MPIPASPIAVKTSNMAVASVVWAPLGFIVFLLVLGVWSKRPSWTEWPSQLNPFSWRIWLSFIPAVLPAIVFGHAARRAIKRSEGKLKGKDSAVGGLILGWFILFLILINLPNMRSSWRAQFQSVAVGSVRALKAAASTYHSTYGRFPPNLAALGPPPEGEPANANHSNLVDNALASGRKSAYTFTYKVTARDDKGMATGYAIFADPVTAGSSMMHYFTDESEAIRFQEGRPADKGSPPLAG